jgi:predicted O-methyltransferase YrrM
METELTIALTKHSSVRRVLAFPVFLFVLVCAGDSSGSVELDKVLSADYGRWGQMVESNQDLYEKELIKLNPYYEAAKRESITNRAQKIILSLLAMQKKHGFIAELGSWTGGGVLLMAPYLTHDKSYHAVDTFNADTMDDLYIKKQLRGRKHIDVFYENTAPLKNKIVVHRGRTNDIAATWPKGQPIDLLFIDADHSYEAVSADWKNWSPFVRKGGIIAFHDYYVKKQGGHQGVRRLIDESIANRVTKKLYYIEGLAWYVVE